MEPVTPISIAAAAVLAQLSLIAIVTLGSLVLRSGDSYGLFRDPDDSTKFFPLTLCLAVPALALIILTEEFAVVAQPMFAGSIMSVGTLASVMPWMFAIDTAWLALLVRMSGGSWQSPFAPLLLLLPTLAIFLRESVARVALYAIVAAFLLTLLLAERLTKACPGGHRRTMAYWVVATLSLVLTTFIGLITRAD
ncbi:MAG: hypothetical protein KA745_03750 [Gemmatimonadales bacterium]|nr:hypothetical protein [Gemmatimonadales bacterium]